jgi:hypothetical protein
MTRARLSWSSSCCAHLVGQPGGTTVEADRKRQRCRRKGNASMTRTLVRGFRTGLLLALLVPPVTMLAAVVFWVVVLSL